MEPESLPPKPPDILVVGPEEHSVVRPSGLRRSTDTLGLLSMALALSAPNTATRTVEDLLSFLPSYHPHVPLILPCLICGQPSGDGKDFCSAKHATLYYQNQKAKGVYKGDRRLPRSKRKKK